MHADRPASPKLFMGADILRRHFGDGQFRRLQADSKMPDVR